jgi:hypothetical protein
MKIVELNEKVSIESLILANHVELVNDLLYVSGGGWTNHIRIIPLGSQPQLSHIGIALIAAVPWNQTNRNHTLIIELRDEDAKSIFSLTAQTNVGRSPGMRPGTMQYPKLALPINLTFPHAGVYEVVARVEGVTGSERRWAFQVQDVQPLAATA